MDQFFGLLPGTLNFQKLLKHMKNFKRNLKKKSLLTNGFWFHWWLIYRLLDWNLSQECFMDSKNCLSWVGNTA